MPLNLGPQVTIHRFARKEAANIVADAMRPLTNVRISVKHDPVSESDRKKGVGDWAVVFDNEVEYVPCDRNYRMSQCANFALALALADALRKTDPLHPLLSTWHLVPENRNLLMKYYYERET